MENKNILFLGAKKIGFECLKYIFENKKQLSINLIGVFTNPRGKQINEFCKRNNITVYKELDDILTIDNCDIAISVQYDKILKSKHINIAKEIIVNLHMAPLPEYRGCNQFSYAIINDDDIFGTTIHRLEAGVDSGDIIFEKRFNIPRNAWVEELYNITFEKSIELFKESISKLVNRDYTLTPQESLINERGTSLHFRKEILDLKKIDLSWSKGKIERHIRATYMPGFDPPYTIINGIKVNFNKE